jgi:hypothetical protein
VKVPVTENKTGKTREMHQHYANILVKTGKYHVAALNAEPVSVVAEEDVSPRTGKPKRQYRRKDMAAEA